MDADVLQASWRVVPIQQVRSDDVLPLVGSQVQALGCGHGQGDHLGGVVGPFPRLEGALAAHGDRRPGLQRRAELVAGPQCIPAGCPDQDSADLV